MLQNGDRIPNSWFSRKQDLRAQRALERQLEYQEHKAAGLGESDDLGRSIFLRAQQIRQKIAAVRPVAETDAVLEVGSGAHGLVFGFGGNFGVGIDPLAVDYKRLFPKWQHNAATVAAVGEQLPFADESFEIVLSDNVIDHAREPLKIVDEIVRVLKPGGVLYFTVNVHHPIYELASRAHGLWNAAGLKLELSAFADHTVHFTEARIRDAFSRVAVDVISQSSTVAETRKAQRLAKNRRPHALLKKLFFKNALFELVAVKS
jgi:SAM-dependent methyltransferase